MQDCIFCKIIKKEISGKILDKTKNIIVFLSLENHPLIVPKKHVENLYSLDKKLGGEIMQEAKKIALAMKKGLKCDGIYIAQSNGVAAGQEVFHYHMHLYPKWLDKRKIKTDEMSKKIMEQKIKAFL